MSANRISTPSSQPPKYPADSPIVTPIVPARTSVANPTAIEILAPYNIWANRSCPTWSVPKIAYDPSDNRLNGGRNRSAVRVSTGL